MEAFEEKVGDERWRAVLVRPPWLHDAWMHDDG